MTKPRIIHSVEELEALDPDTAVLSNDHELDDVKIVLEEKSITDGSQLSPLWFREDADARAARKALEEQ